MERRNPVILHVSTASSWRGGEQQLAYLVNELKKERVTQHVLCARGSEMEAFCSRSHFPYTAAHKRSSLDILYARKIATISNDNKVSIVHTHDSHAHSLAVVAADVFGNKRPIIVSRRVDFPIGRSLFSRYKYNHRCVQRLLCVSDKIREIVSASLRDPHVAVTVHSGIDPARFPSKGSRAKLREEYGLDASTKIVANVAALAAHKDYYTFVDAAAAICQRRNDVSFFIIGDGPLEKDIATYVSRSGFAARIRMTGFRTDISDIFPEFDVFLISSQTEGLGTSVLDAFACDVPVVATAAGGIPEMVLHGKTGLISPVKDSRSLANHVERVLDEEPLRRTLTQNAAEHLKSFTTKATAAKTLECYLGVLAAGTAQTGR